MLAVNLTDLSGEIKGFNGIAFHPHSNLRHSPMPHPYSPVIILLAIPKAFGYSGGMKNIIGYAAIEAKEQNPAVVVCKYNDPTEAAREDITAEEARQIAKEDSSLIYAHTPNGKATVRQNRWGNWRGYIGGKFAREFHFDTGFIGGGLPQAGLKEGSSTEMPEAARDWLKANGGTR